jgi:methylase of polypeptide subunit release factors
MQTGELRLWLPLSRLLLGMCRLRWLRLAVAGAHFHVDAVCLIHDHIWDGTSLILRKGIRRYARDGDRVLDMGTGHLGLLAVYCARTHNVQVVAVDVNEEFVENARLIAKVSEAPNIEFRQSDWFAHVDGRFDLIFGNVPYVPTKVGLASQDVHEFPEIWNGGDDGMAHARSILAQVAGFLKPKGLLLLGINAAYVPRRSTLALLDASEDLELREIVKSWISTSEVYVIGQKTRSNSDC